MVYLIYFYTRHKVESARSRPVTGTTAAQKLEARRLQMLTKQRERLEEEDEALEQEVVALVAYASLSFFPCTKILDRS